MDKFHSEAKDKLTHSKSLFNMISSRQAWTFSTDNSREGARDRQLHDDQEPHKPASALLGKSVDSRPHLFLPWREKNDFQREKSMTSKCILILPTLISEEPWTANRHDAPRILPKEKVRWTHPLKICKKWPILRPMSEKRWIMISYIEFS